MNLLSFGEILFDIIEEKPHIGGAPFNLAAHVAKLGADSCMISAVGNDMLGRKAIESARALKVNTSMIRSLNRQKTGVVTVDLNEEGIPLYTIHENSAWDSISIDEQIMDNISALEWDYFCFGSLAQRSENNRIQLKRALSAGSFKKIFFDINLRLHYYTKQIVLDSLSAADIVKQNDDEVLELTTMLELEFPSMEEYAHWIINKYSVEILVITLGSKGAMVFTRDKTESVPGIKVAVSDTVGAGDSFSAAFLVTLFNTGDPLKATQAGCKLGAIVASGMGAVPEYEASEILNLASYK